MVDNELLHFNNELSFNELIYKSYNVFDEQGFPLMWIRDNRIVLPNPKLVSFEKGKFEKKQFLPKSVNNLGEDRQRRLITDYFISISEKPDIYFDFFGFLGIHLKGDFFRDSIWYNSPSQIESILFPHLEVKCAINRTKSGAFIFHTDKISNVSEVDSKLVLFEGYVKQIQKFFGQSEKLEKGCISRYHTKEQQKEFIGFFRNLDIIPAKDLLNESDGGFFADYVRN